MAAQITNQDILNAIRGLYQSPNKVTDDATRNKLNDVISALSGLSTTAKQDDIINALGDIATQATLEQLQAKLEAIENKLNEQVIEDGAALTKLTGSNVVENSSKSTIETVVDAVSVAANGGRAVFPITSKGEAEIYIAVSIDQTPWNLRTGWMFFPSHEYGSMNTVYIDESKKESTASINNPCLAFYQGLPVNRLPGGAMTVETLEQAKKVAIPPTVGGTPIEGKIENMNETEVATVTVRLLRVWR